MYSVLHLATLILSFSIIVRNRLSAAGIFKSKALRNKIASRDRKISELQLNLKMLREELIKPDLSGSCENIAHLAEIN